MSSELISKLDLLKKVNEIQFKIQKNKQILRDLLGRDEKKSTHVLNEKSIEINEVNVLKERRLGKEMKVLFLDLIKIAFHTSIDQILTQSFNDRILVLYQDHNYEMIKKDKNLNESFVDTMKMELIKLQPTKLRSVDKIVFYQFNLIELCNAMKFLNEFLNENQKLAAIVDANLKDCLTNFQQKIKSNLDQAFSSRNKETMC